jgi:hypothetical protein
MMHGQKNIKLSYAVVNVGDINYSLSKRLRVKGTIKFVPLYAMETQGRVEVELHSFISAVDGSGWSGSCLGCFNFVLIDL